MSLERAVQPEDLPDLLAECGVFPPKLAHHLALAYRAQLAEIARQRAAEAALQGLLAMRDPSQWFGTDGIPRAYLVADAVKIGDALLAQLAAPCSICGISLAEHTLPGKCPQ